MLPHKSGAGLESISPETFSGLSAFPRLEWKYPLCFVLFREIPHKIAIVTTAANHVFFAEVRSPNSVLSITLRGVSFSFLNKFICIFSSAVESS